MQRDNEENTSDEDNDPLPNRKKRKEEFMQIIKSDIQSIKADVEEIKSLTKDPDTKLPLGFQNEIFGAFKCCICHVVPIRPPLIIAKCCKSIIGCEQCINEWYGGEDGMTKTCPLCRADRAFTETMRLNGVEGFIKTLSEIISQRENSENQSTSVTAE